MFGMSNEIHRATDVVLIPVCWQPFKMSEQKGRETVSNKTINNPGQTLGDMEVG